MTANSKINNCEDWGVDTHAHIFTQELNLIRAGEGYVPDYDATLATYLGKLRSHGFTHAVLIQPSFLGSDNSHLLQAVRQHLDRMRCIVIAKPSTPLGELKRLKEGGAVGVRLILFVVPQPDFRSRAWTTFLRNITDLDWIVEIYSPASLLPILTPTLIGHGCRLLIDHYGRPDPNLGEKDPGFRHLLRLSEGGKVWVDISGPYRNGDGLLGEELSVGYLSSLRESFGLERILWGSDWPCVRFEPWNSFDSSCVFLGKVISKHKERKVVLWETPAALFGFV